MVSQEAGKTGQESKVLQRASMTAGHKSNTNSENSAIKEEMEYKLSLDQRHTNTANTNVQVT